MYIAISYFNENISTVFDFSEKFLILEYKNDKEIKRTLFNLEEKEPQIRSKKFLDMGIELIICGAISRKSVFLLRNYGIKIIPFITGNVEEVIKAYSNGNLQNSKYLLPGYPKGGPEWFCHKRYRFQKGRRCRSKNG